MIYGDLYIPKNPILEQEYSSIQHNLMVWTLQKQSLPSSLISNLSDVVRKKLPIDFVIDLSHVRDTEEVRYPSTMMKIIFHSPYQNQNFQ